MPFNIAQFKDYILEQFRGVDKRIDASEEKTRVLAEHIAETDKEAVRLQAVYETDHMPKAELERRLTRLEVKVAVWSSVGGLLGGAIVAAIVEWFRL